MLDSLARESVHNMVQIIDDSFLREVYKLIEYQKHIEEVCQETVMLVNQVEAALVSFGYELALLS